MCSSLLPAITTDPLASARGYANRHGDRQGSGIVGDDSPDAHDIVRVGGPFAGDAASKHDVRRFLHREFGALDEVGEVGIVESERGGSFRFAFAPRPIGGRRVAQCLVQSLKQLKPCGIIGPAGVSSSRQRRAPGHRLSGPRTENSAYQGVEPGRWRALKRGTSATKAPGK